MVSHGASLHRSCLFATFSRDPRRVRSSTRACARFQRVHLSATCPISNLCRSVISHTENISHRHVPPLPARSRRGLSIAHAAAACSILRSNALPARNAQRNTGQRRGEFKTNRMERERVTETERGGGGEEEGELIPSYARRRLTQKSVCLGAAVVRVRSTRRLSLSPGSVCIHAIHRARPRFISTG